MSVRSWGAESSTIFQDQPSTASNVQTPKRRPRTIPSSSPPSTSTSSSSFSRRSGPRKVPFFPFWMRLSRLVFGRIKRLPRSMTTTLVLFTVHMYLTVPFIVATGLTGDLQALFRPFRLIKASGYEFSDLEQYHDIL